MIKMQEERRRKRGRRISGRNFTSFSKRIGQVEVTRMVKVVFDYKDDGESVATSSRWMRRKWFDSSKEVLRRSVVLWDGRGRWCKSGGSGRSKGGDA